MTDIKVFTTIKSPEFQQIFRDIPRIEAPFTYWLSKEFRGIHNGENLAIIVEKLLIELSLKDKLISITGDNTSNNKAIALKVEDIILALLYQGLNSYLCYLAYILNLIIIDIPCTLGLAALIYYGLYKLLNNIRKGNTAVKERIKKYEKYYSIIDDYDTYYNALVLDPWVKGKTILRELQDNNTGAMILETIRTNLHQVYAGSNPDPYTAASDVESRILKKLQARDPPLLDIDKYFDTPSASQTLPAKLAL
ncbi:hypothetical protein N7481_001287 [Penicillium waksmanii]|uniref:uncharacterized protein n=1 Tax=Penicillium waksmanii TaxID=69791 RepID=UPI002548E64B|nr:uncharacterized protein N7481_001287 [Penicillium waksmanii]KAJ6000878.1 hypothetical protein N7481_001287 [Penicillium waksmanii]